MVVAIKQIVRIYGSRAGCFYWLLKADLVIDNDSFPVPALCCKIAYLLCKYVCIPLRGCSKRQTFLSFAIGMLR